MALPDSFIGPFRETGESIRSRLLASVPPHLSTVEGSWARDLIELMVAEYVLLWASLNRMLSYRYVRYAYAQLLDAHGENYGEDRLAPTAASGIVRFTGDEGVAIPPATLVSVPSSDPDEPRPVYRTLNTISQVIAEDPGYVDVKAEAVDPGAYTNQAVGQIKLVDSPTVSVEEVSNVTAMTGGSDPEDDDHYRRRLTEAARLSTGAGTLRDMVLWALEVPGVWDVAAKELWDLSGTTPGVSDGREHGSVIVSVRSPGFVAVDWAELQAAQKHLDPARQVIALLEQGEPWVDVSGDGTLGWGTTDVQTGEKALTINAPGIGTDVVALVRDMDLSRFFDVDDFFLWIKADNWANLGATSHVRFYTDDDNHYTAALSVVTALEPTKPTTGAAWWRWRVEKGQFTATGSPDWSHITKVEISQVAINGFVLGTWDYWTIRNLDGSVGEGRAPTDQDVTVVTPVPKAIPVTADVTLRTGYTLSGAVGTTDATSEVRTALEALMREVKPDAGVVKKIDIANVLHDYPGIEDFTLSAPAANVPITMNQYAVLGTLTLA